MIFVWFTIYQIGYFLCCEVADDFTIATAKQVVDSLVKHIEVATAKQVVDSLVKHIEVVN